MAKMAEVGQLGAYVSVSNKIADNGCLGNPKVNSGVICYVNISGWEPPFYCGCSISMALRSEVLGLAFASVFPSLSVWI